MTDHDEITRLWSDDELDDALRSLHSDLADSTVVLAAARAKVLAAASGDQLPGAVTAAWMTFTGEELAASEAPAQEAGSRHARRRWIRVALAASIAAVLVAIGLLVPSFITKQNRQVNSAAAISALNQAAVASLGATDEPVGPVSTGTSRPTPGTRFSAATTSIKDETLSEVWVPATPGRPHPGLDARPPPDRQPGLDQRQRRSRPARTAPSQTRRPLASPCAAQHRAGTFTSPDPAHVPGRGRTPPRLSSPASLGTRPSCTQGSRPTHPTTGGATLSFWCTQPTHCDQV